MTLEKNSRKKIFGLDFLKTLAIIAVTLFHISADKFPGSFFGVTIFFVVSGFLIAYTSEISRREENFSFINFFLRKIKRLYPSLLIVIFSTVGIYYFLAPKLIETVRPEIISVLLGYNNWWQISQNADYFARLNSLTPFTHLWFLGVELQYFLIFPVIFFIYSKLPRNFGLIFVGILALISAVIMPLMSGNADVTRLYYGTDTRIHALLFGTFFGFLFASTEVENKISDAEKVLKQTFFTIFLSGLLASTFFVSGKSQLVWQGGMIFQAAVICLLLIFLADERLGIGKFFEKNIFTWLGKKSYGIFLWQYPIFFLFTYRGWNNLFLEITLIILFTLWSDCLSKFLTSRSLPNFENYMPLVRKSFFISVTIFGMIVMGFGFKGVAVSAEKNADTENLKVLLEENQNLLEAENLQAKKIPEVQENIPPQTPENVPPQTPENVPPQNVDLSGTVIVGDSITLASANELREALPNCYIDAKVSRSIFEGLSAVQDCDYQGLLGKNVVISLGTNDSIEEFESYKAELQDILNYLGPDRNVFLVNIYYTPYAPYQEWLNTNHEYIKKLATENKNIFEVDWYSAISQQPQEIISDGIHPTEAGSQIYAKVIHDKIYEEVAKQK